MSFRTLIRLAAATLVLATTVCLVRVPTGIATDDIAGKIVIVGQGMHAA